MRKRHLAMLALAGLGLAGSIAPVPAVAAAPVVSLSATAIDFGSAPWLQSGATQGVVLTNTGDAPLNVCCIDLSNNSFVPQDFFISLDQCSFRTIAPGGQCAISFRFTPQSGGPRVMTASIFDNAADSPQKLTLTGTGTGGVIRFTSRFIDFGTVAVGTTSAPMSFTAVNAGDGPATISRLTLSTAPPTVSWFAITSDACSGTTLGPGQRCTVTATATPTAVTSAFRTVTLVDNVGTGQQRFDLNVFGGGPLVSVLNGVPTLNQGVGTTSAPVALQVFAAGTQPLQIASVALDNPSAGFTVTHDGCSGTTVPLNTPFNTPPPTCEIDYVFAPPAPGSWVANLVFHDNEFGGAGSVALSGNGLAPVAVPSTGAIDFGFQAPSTTSAARLVTLSNPSPQSLTINSVSISGSGFALASNLCSGTIVAPGGSCAVGVSFTPPFPYLFSATLVFSDNAAGSPPGPQIVALRGEGTASTFRVSTTLLNFGNVKAKTTPAAQTVTVTNTSTAAAGFGVLPGAGVRTTNGCGAAIAPGATCDVTVTISSPSVGPQSSLVKIFDAANQQAVEEDWTGTSGFAFLTDGLINNELFQIAGTTATVTAELQNGGTDVLNVGQVVLTNTPPAVVTNDNCSNHALAVAHSCTFQLIATPTAVGPWSTTITVPTDAAVGPNPATIPIFGGGIALHPAQPVFSPGSISFAPQQLGTETTQVVWLDNGLAPAFFAQSLTIASTAIGGTNPAPFRIVWDGCSGTTLDAAFSCPVEVGFNPAGSGTFNSSLLFNDDAAGSPHAVSLTGVGISPATVSPQHVDFGQVTVHGKSAPAAVTLTNTGTSTFSVSRVSISGVNKGDFATVTDACSGQTLAPGRACQVTLVFRPEAVGTATATMTFADTAANSPQTVALGGTGTAK